MKEESCVCVRTCGVFKLSSTNNTHIILCEYSQVSVIRKTDIYPAKRRRIIFVSGLDAANINGQIDYFLDIV